MTLQSTASHITTSHYKNVTADCYAKKQQGVDSVRGQVGTALLQCATGDTEDSFFAADVA